jgi:hypothetical protein
MNIVKKNPVVKWQLELAICHLDRVSNKRLKETFPIFNYVCFIKIELKKWRRDGAARENNTQRKWAEAGQVGILFPWKPI